jgi:hypothetical protein
VPPMEGLESLLAEREIRDVIYRYCRGVDRVDLDLVRSCYHPDGIDDHGSFRGDADEYVGWLAERLGRYQHTSHTIGNVLIRLGEAEAWVESYCGVHQRYSGEDGRLLDRHGDLRYVDRFALREGQWLISHRRVVWGTARVDPVGESALPAGAIVGSRDRSDASYREP